MKTIFLVLIFISFNISPVTSTAPEDCGSESANPRNVPFLQPDGHIFTIVNVSPQGLSLALVLCTFCLILLRCCHHYVLKRTPGTSFQFPVFSLNHFGH
ncbi:unnamed protein product [Brassica rapa subsp. narinosa]